MKKEKSIQADIEVLQELQGGVLSDRWGKAITRSIQALEAMRDAEMPERMVTPKFSGKKGYFEFQHERNRGINVGIDLCQPVASKLLEENKELRKKIKELENA